MNLTLGRMRCLEALGEWYDNLYFPNMCECCFYFIRGKLYDLSCDSWNNELDEDIRQKMASMATSAAWGLGEIILVKTIIHSRRELSDLLITPKG